MRELNLEEAFESCVADVRNRVGLLLRDIVEGLERADPNWKNLPGGQELLGDVALVSEGVAKAPKGFLNSIVNEHLSVDLFCVKNSATYVHALAKARALAHAKK